MRTTLIYGIIALVLVIIVAAFAFFFTGSQGNGESAGENGGGFFGSLFPFSFSGNGGDSPLLEGGDSEPGQDTRPVPRLRQISDQPVSGMFAYTNENGDTHVRFIERETGNVFETRGSSFETKRITNTTIPGIQEVLWVNKNEFILRYLNDDTVENFYARIQDAEEEQSITGTFLSPWDRAALDPEHEALLSVTETTSGSRVALSDPDGGSERTLLTSPIRSWVPLQSETSTLIQSAPASGLEGFLYTLRGGALIKIFGGMPGLVAVPNKAGDSVLVSSGDRNTLSLSRVSVPSGEIAEVPLATIASKCVWSDEALVVCGIPNSVPQAAYPTDWLLGRVAFSDSLWEIDIEAGAASLLVDLESEANIPIDVWRPQLSEDGSYLLFLNKNDLSLWSYRLTDTEPVVTDTAHEDSSE